MVEALTDEESVQPSDSIKKQILNLYNRDPRGWRVFVGRDPKGFSEVTITHPPHAWLLKEQIINPFRAVGLGVKLTLEEPKIFNDQLPHDFGLRPLSNRRMQEIVRLMERGQPVQDVMEKIMKTSPIPLTEAPSFGNIFAQGPVVVRQDALKGLSRNQRELDRRLDVELERLLLRKYPQTLLPYM